MNHKRYFVLLLALVIAIGASAQFASFRSQSTAGLLDGDIEHILVPGEMFMVEGWNIYTNLSNFAYQSENVFAGASSPNYMIGGKGNFGMIQVGVLHRSDHYGYAYIDSLFNTVHTDTDGNLDYDMLDESTEFDYYDYIEYDDETYFGFAFGDKETTNFGIGYRRYNSTYDEIGHDTLANVSTNLITDVVTYNDMEYYDYQVTGGDVWNEYVLSVYQPMDNMGIEFNGYFAPTKYSYDGMETDTFFQNFSPEAPHADYYTDGYALNEEYKYNYTRWGFDLSARNETEEYLGEAYVAYANHSTGDSESYFGYETNYAERQYPGITDSVFWTEWEELAAEDSTSNYSYARQDFSTGLRYVKKLNKVLFGVGFGYSLYTYTYQVLADYNYDYTYTYNNGDGVLDGADYTQTETGTWSREENYAYLRHSLYLPVCVEFDAWKNVVMRLGANTRFNWAEDYSSDVWTAYNSGIGVINYEDGTTTEYLIENPVDRDDEYYTGSYTDRYTTYYYGAGWTISENMYIDFMGFSNLVNLTGWKVSANVKFL